MTKIELAKKSIGFVAGWGAAKIVTGVVQNNAPQEKSYNKVAVFAGEMVLTSMIAELVQDHVDEQVDKFVIWWHKKMTDFTAK